MVSTFPLQHPGQVQRKGQHQKQQAEPGDEQIVPLLNKSGILRTNRGYQGGYRLARTAEKYTVGEILELTEGSLAPIACLDTEENICPHRGECITLSMWEGLHKVIKDYLFGITLQDIIDKSVTLEGGDYCI